MLVLTRRIGEQIVIDEEILITVTAIAGNRVRIGVTAPDFVRVDREEIHALRSRSTPSRRPLARSSAG
jgi:carbon storage regulator